MSTESNAPLTEQHITELVGRFYQRALTDASLRPVFEAVIQDWDVHHRLVADFWSCTLLDTQRYRGSPYAVHACLPLRPKHFEQWLIHFRETAREVLPAAAAER